MTAQTYDTPLSQPAQLRRTAVLTWLELPRVAVIGLVWVALALPLLTGFFGVPWLLVALAALPSCLFATGFARFAATLARGGRPRLRDAFRIDVVLGGTIELGVLVAAAMLATGGAFIIPGALLTAVLLLVVPIALAYGAVRERVGLSAWRGGLILVAYRPGSALTLLALNCLAGFAIVASLGTLGLVLPSWLLAYASAGVSAQLDGIDRQSGTP